MVSLAFCLSFSSVPSDSLLLLLFLSFCIVVLGRGRLEETLVWESERRREPAESEMGNQRAEVVIREFDPVKDMREVNEIDKKCDVGASEEVSLFTDLLGDPICRIRHSPAYLMLVAVMGSGEDKQLVGMIRGCVKTVTCTKNITRNGKNGGNDSFNPVAVYSEVGYILGLRVSPSHRRMGIGLKLVKKMEEWFVFRGAEYSYMATEKSNEASLKLFTERCGYQQFRNPSILVHPVFAHEVFINRRVRIFQLSPLEAEILYRSRFSTTEFFPRDIGSILNNPLNLGTFVAIPSSESTDTWPGVEDFLSNPPQSWAVISIWNTKEVFSVQLGGASVSFRGIAKTSRYFDETFPWLHIPSIPKIFRPFGFHFMYGLGGEGPQAAKMMKALCGFAHNFAKERGCQVVVTSVSNLEPLKVGIPYWKLMSCDDDLWCIKRLGGSYNDCSVGDWTKSAPGSSIFVDPREF